MNNKMNDKEIKNIFSWVAPYLEVRVSSIDKKGVFTTKKIHKGDIITIFGGYIMTLEEAEKLPKEFVDNGMQISEDFELNSKTGIEISNYFNHSCDPNVGFKGQIFLVAMRDILEDEEITFDYAMVLYHSDKAALYNVKCSCGSRNCRKQINEDDWKKKDLQDKYDGYFQWFLQEKINNLKK